MKHVLRLLTLAGAVAGAVWYSRQQSRDRRRNPPVVSGRPDRSCRRCLIRPRRRPRRPESDDDLTEIKGVGPKYSQQLNELGISSFASLAAADPEALSAEFEARADVEDWIAQARTRSGT